LGHPHGHRHRVRRRHLGAVGPARASTGAKPFLLSVAIVDDILAIAVVAIFYSDGVKLWWLVIAVAGYWWPRVCRSSG
jgi:hypothetical protein